MEGPRAPPRGTRHGWRDRPPPSRPRGRGKRTAVPPRFRRRPPEVPRAPRPVRRAGVAPGRPQCTGGDVATAGHAHPPPEGAPHPRVPTRVLRHARESVPLETRGPRRDFAGRAVEAPAGCREEGPDGRARTGRLTTSWFAAYRRGTSTTTKESLATRRNPLIVK